MKKPRGTVMSGVTSGSGRSVVVLVVAALLMGAVMGYIASGPRPPSAPGGFADGRVSESWSSASDWLRIVADASMFGANLAFGVVLLLAALRVKGVAPSASLALMGVWVCSCAGSHLLDAIESWHPPLLFGGAVKALAAIMSGAAVVVMFRALPAVSKLHARSGELESLRRNEADLTNANRELKEAYAVVEASAARSEDALQRSEREFRESLPAEAVSRLVIENAPSAQIMIDAAGRICLFNRMAERIFGYARADVLGKEVECLVPDALRAQHVASRKMYQGQPSAREMGAGRELFGVRADGAQLPIEIGLNPIEIGGGRFVLAVVIDITSRKLVQLELQHYVEALAASNAELEQFTLFASHDLQEPLRKLISFAGLLAEDLPSQMPEAARKDLEFITDAAVRMRALVRGLLDLSHSSRRELRTELVDLQECAADALEAVSERVKETGASIVTDALPKIIGDRLLLTQLFQNLIGNALKFQLPSVQPAVRITSERETAGWKVVVADNGIGLKPEYAKEIFKPFRRLHGRGVYEGTGIGLTLCSKAVERHGGRIWVTSTPGAGARFHFTLPDQVQGASKVGVR